MISTQKSKCFSSFLIYLFSVHVKSKPVDKSNFKKHNVFAAYVNAQFN